MKRFRCPGCGIDQFPDNLESNKEMKEEVEKFLRGGDQETEQKEVKGAAVVSLTEISEEKRRKNPFKIVGDAPALPTAPILTAPQTENVTKKPAFRIVDAGVAVRPPMGQIPGNPAGYYPNGNPSN